jgi:hypothetical protein
VVVPGVLILTDSSQFVLRFFIVFAVRSPLRSYDERREERDMRSTETMKKSIIHLLLALALVAPALAEPAVHGHPIQWTGPNGATASGNGRQAVLPGHGRAGASAGAVNGPQGSTASGARASVAAPGKGRAAAGGATVTTRNGASASAAGSHGWVRGKGGYKVGGATWNGTNSSGQATTSAVWKRGSGLTSSSSGQVTSKKTGQTYGASGSTTYNRSTGGSTTVTTDAGKTVTKTYGR